MLSDILGTDGGGVRRWPVGMRARPEAGVFASTSRHISAKQREQRMRYIVVVVMAWMLSACASVAPACRGQQFGAIKVEPVGVTGKVFGLPPEIPEITRGMAFESSGFSCGSTVAADIERRVAYSARDCSKEGSEPLPEAPAPSDKFAASFTRTESGVTHIIVVRWVKLSESDVARLVCAGNAVWTAKSKFREYVVPPHSVSYVRLRDQQSYKDQGGATEMGPEAKELIRALEHVAPANR